MSKDGKKAEPPKNLLEKLIRLDKKNSNFNIQDLELKRKLKIRNNPNIKTPFFSTHLHDHGLKHFWKHVCNYYFRKIEQNEIERLDYLEMMLNKPIKEQMRKYSDWRSYLYIKSIFSYSLKHGVPNDPSLSKLNYHNILKQWRLSNKLSPLTNPDMEESLRDDSDYILTHKILKPNKKSSLKEYLVEEDEKLDQLLEVIEQNEESINENDEITQQIESLLDEMNQINHINLKKLRKLKEIIKIENNSSSICYIRTAEKPKLKKQEMVLFQQKQMLENPQQKDMLLKYLKHTIIRLEQKQLAESIEQITGTKKLQKNNPTFEVFFEQNLTSKPSYLSEDQLCQLDKLRENSLFIYYNIPQKGLFSFISQNFVGLENILEKNTKSIVLNKGKSLLSLMRKRLAESLDENFMETEEKNQDFSMCHHCKLYFYQKNLIRCNYRSSLMGTPIVNRNHSDPMLYNENLKGNDSKKRGLTNCRKRNNYCNYYKKNGEFFCVRQYCRICLKQNYDFNIQEISTKTDWICPFCQGVCFCTRCLRNNLITKLKGMFIFYGGALPDISKDSPFEKHIKICEEAPFLKEKSHPLSLKSTPTEKTSHVISKEALNVLKLRMREYKRHFKEFIKLKSLRTNMEKLRLISSQIIRREKLKLRLSLLDQDIFEKESESFKSLLKQKKYLDESSKKKTMRLLKKSITKKVFVPKIKKYSRKRLFTVKKKSKNKTPAPQQLTYIKSPSEILKPLINHRIKLKIREKNLARKNKLLKLIRKTTNTLLPEQMNQRKSPENPNEPSDGFVDGDKKVKFLKCELKGLVKTQNSKELSLFMEISKKSAINKKILRSRNVKRKLRSNKMYRFQF